MILREKDKRILIEIFDKVNLPFEVWAYGSRVSGDAHDGSDLDLVLRMHDLSKFPIEEFIFLKDAIQNSKIPILVDLHDWARIPVSFHNNILSCKEILYSNINIVAN
jgi:predicted nucleotidyltransferase